MCGDGRTDWPKRRGSRDSQFKLFLHILINKLFESPFRTGYLSTLYGLWSLKFSSLFTLQNLIRGEPVQFKCQNYIMSACTRHPSIHRTRVYWFQSKCTPGQGCQISYLKTQYLHVYSLILDKRLRYHTISLVFIIIICYFIVRSL